MAQCNPVQWTFFPAMRKELSADVPRLLFQIAAARLLALNHERQSQPTRQLADKLFVRLRLSASKLMVYVKQGQLECQIAAEAVKDMQQNNGVRASGHSYAYPIAGRQHAITSDDLAHPLDQIVRQ